MTNDKLQMTNGKTVKNRQTLKPETAAKQTKEAKTVIKAVSKQNCTTQYETQKLKTTPAENIPTGLMKILKRAERQIQPVFLCPKAAWYSIVESNISFLFANR